MDSIKAQFPKGADPQAWALELANEIEIAKANRNALVPRWQRNRHYYQNTPAAKADKQLPYAGASDSHINLTQIKADALVTYVVGTITGQSPYCVAKAGSGDEESRQVSKTCERIVQWFAEHGKLDYVLRQAGVVAGLTNMGVVRASFCHREKDIKFTVIEPQYLIGYPTYCRDWADLKIIGDEFTRRKAQIDEMIQSGMYIPYPDNRAASEDQFHATMREAVNPATTGARAGETVHDPIKDGPVTLYDLVVKAPGDDGRETWWGVTLDLGGRHILRCELSPYGDPGYALFAYKVNLGNFYAEESVAQDLQGLQTELNELFNLANDGSRMNVFGQAFSPGGAPGADFVRISPGSILQGAGLDQVTIFSPRADLTYILPLSEMIMRVADQAARISSAGVGGQLRSRTTATEAELVASGQQSGVNEYISTFGMGLEHLYEVVQDLLYKHLGDWFPVWGAQIGVTVAEAQSLGVRQSWSLHGRSVSANPISQMQLAEMLMNLANNASTGLDTYALAGRVLEYAERRGFANADGLQMPRDPGALVPFVANALGIDPELLAGALQSVQARQQQLMDMVNNAPDEPTSQEPAAPVRPFGNPGVAG